MADEIALNLHAELEDARLMIAAREGKANRRADQIAALRTENVKLHTALAKEKGFV